MEVKRSCCSLLAVRVLCLRRRGAKSENRWFYFFISVVLLSDSASIRSVDHQTMPLISKIHFREDVSKHVRWKICSLISQSILSFSVSFNEYFSIHARSEASTDSGLVHALCAPQTQKPINLKQLLDPVPPPQICAKTCFCFSKNSRGRTGIWPFNLIDFCV